ncbi:translation initiation factor [Grosmannia clavigera kw1407]|uniref:Translation initiation factor n=1 Tax=Grosmannia clavigera (strain kw1407 / UAMH 11150) TaxID=655863 RepID=F0XM46_GROCL|nr:translation initiation factor [Grosmannia clavigera kw1407]EFX01274.1 translation initiation factor [Grosmannia clavigera kw1407]
MDNLYGRRTNSSNKLSLSTNNGPSTGNTGDASSPFSLSTRSATIPKRFGGDSSSHGKANSFNPATTPGGRIMSPTGASSAFGLGSGAFSSFGAPAKTPKLSGGNPFDFGAKPPSSATAASASASFSSLAGDKPSSTAPQLGAPGASNSSFAGNAGAAGDKGKQHALVSEWVFWFRPPISKANGYIEYEKTLHPIAAVGTVEEFFTIYRHLKRPSTLPLVSDYHFFRTGIRPIWEDAENRKGGKWIVRLKKGVVDRYWEDLLLAIVGDQLGDSGDEVCGVVLSVRNGEDILSIWTRNDGSSVC